LRPTDQHRQDDQRCAVADKLVAVPISKPAPTYDKIKTIDNLPAIERARIEQFFAVYKKLPDGRKVVEMKGTASTPQWTCSRAASTSSRRPKFRPRPSNATSPSWMIGSSRRIASMSLFYALCWPMRLPASLPPPS
jgi:hypothetical protein